jgi:CheY-like chemotaxis protein
MSKSGPIVLVDDDVDDREIFAEVVQNIGSPRQVIWFHTSLECMNYLKTTDDSPFIIFCDVNLPMQNGVDFKREIDSDPELRRKSIPFIFYSTSVDQIIVNEVYGKMTVQGFFRKESSLGDIRECLARVIDYWEHCHHPNSV